MIPFGVEKLEWFGFPNIKKNFEDMYNRLETIPSCDGQTDGQTSCDGIVRAMHTCRAVKIERHCLLVPIQCSFISRRN